MDVQKTQKLVAFFHLKPLAQLKLGNYPSKYAQD